MAPNRTGPLRGQRRASQFWQARRATVKSNALEREQLRLGRRPAARREPAELAARRQHAVTRDDDRHWIASHRLADVACAFPAVEAEFLRERAVGRGRSPGEVTHQLVELATERIEAGQIDRNGREIDP